MEPHTGRQRRIAVVIHDLSCGGAERIATELATAWRKSGHITCIMTLWSTGKSFFYVSRKVPVIRVGRHEALRQGSEYARLPQQLQRLCSFGHGVGSTVSRATALRRALKRFKADTVVGILPEANNVAVLATMRSKAQVVLTEQDYPPLTEIDMWTSLLRQVLYERAAAIVVLTVRSVKYFRRSLHPRVHVIPNAMRRGLGIAANRTTSGPFTVLAVGRLEHQKGFDQLIPWFAELARTRPDWQLVIAGEGRQRASLEQLVANVGMTERIALPGVRSDVDTLYATAHIFALTSRHEGFPLALLEAMATGLPTVALDCPTGPGEIIRHEVDGLLADPRDNGEFCRHLASLMDSPAQRGTLGRAACHVTERFGADAIDARWAALWTELDARCD